MILSAQSIRRYGENLIKPFFDHKIIFQGMSYGLSHAGYDVRLKDKLSIPPNGFRLGSTLEYFNIPVNLMMRIVDKSTLARTGIMVQNTVAEPGWHGHLTLEITNHVDSWAELPAGLPIAQVVFELLDEPTDTPYQGKYQDQIAGPQSAIWEVAKDEQVKADEAGLQSQGKDSKDTEAAG